MQNESITNKSILVTGVAGFIGFHLTKKLLELKVPVLGIDNLNTYYDPTLKKARLRQLERISKESSIPFECHHFDLEDTDKLDLLFKGEICRKKYFKNQPPRKVVNLAAQAGVRYSLKNPSAYVQSNLVGFLNILECSKKNNIEHLVYASSSSVYGGNRKIPFSEKDQENLQMVATMLEENVEGRDHVRIVVQPRPNGACTRIEAEEGVLRAIGMAVMQAQMQAAGAGEY